MSKALPMHRNKGYQNAYFSTVFWIKGSDPDEGLLSHTKSHGAAVGKMLEQ